MNIKTPNIQESKTQSKSKTINTQSKKIYNLEERFQDYFERVIKLCKKCPKNSLTVRIIPQAVSSSGSLSANYAEASEAMSKKDFVKSIKISRKEVKESKVWVKGLQMAVDFTDSEFDLLLQEANEIIYILTSILKKTDDKKA